MAIVFTCEHCGEKYRVSLDKAGETAVCRQCHATLTVPTSRLPAEPPLLVPMVESDEDPVLAHLRQTLGDATHVFRELLRDGTPLDVQHLAPTAASPFHTLVTSGMSARPMCCPAGAEDYRYAELAIRLPADWPVSKDAFQQPQHGWPFILLKALARMPHEQQTWLGAGHSIANGTPPAPYASDCPFVGSLLASGDVLAPQFAKLVAADRTIWFWCVLPLLPDELALTMQHGCKAMLQAFSRAKIGPSINVGRKSAIARRSWW